MRIVKLSGSSVRPNKSVTAIFAAAFVLTGCGDPPPPPPIDDAALQQIEQQDAAVADQESQV